MAGLAGLLVLLAVVLVAPRRGRGIHRLQAASARPLGVVERRRLLSIGGADLARSARRRLGILVVIVASGILIASIDPSAVVLTLAAGAIVALIASQRSLSRRHRVAATRRATVIEACDVLAAELSAGRPPADALEGAATICADLRVAAAAAKLGGDVAGTLDLAAESPGAEGLRALAAAWRVAEESGAAFATITERLADSLRADESIRRQISSSLAGPRATARLLAVLPAFGTFIGYAIGADPLAFLLHTPAGWLCLALGLLLTMAGLHWTNTQTKPPWESNHG
jgi:tight adherence protein B